MPVRFGALKNSLKTYGSNRLFNQRTHAGLASQYSGSSAWEAAAKEAKALGYTNFKHFKGGIKGWKDAGLATEQVAAK